MKAWKLADDAIELRCGQADDIPEAVAAVRASLDTLQQWTSWCHADYDAEDVATSLRKKEADRFEDRAYDFYICAAAGPRVLGGAGLYHIDRALGIGSLGYWVRSDESSRGIATAAARLLIRWGFAELGLTRIEVVVAVGNDASHRVAEKVGATREGLLRNRLRLHGHPVDAVGYALIPADLAAWGPGNATFMET